MRTETDYKKYFDSRFLEALAKYEQCANIHDDSKHLDFFNCESCPVRAECVQGFDELVEQMLDRPVSETKAAKLDKQRRGLKKQLQLC